MYSSAPWALDNMPQPIEREYYKSVFLQGGLGKVLDISSVIQKSSIVVIIIFIRYLTYLPFSRHVGRGIKEEPSSEIEI